MKDVWNSEFNVHLVHILISRTLIVIEKKYTFRSNSDMLQGPQNWEKVKKLMCIPHFLLEYVNNENSSLSTNALKIY